MHTKLLQVSVFVHRRVKTSQTSQAYAKYTFFFQEKTSFFGLSHHQEWVQVSLPCRLSINSSIICRNGFRVRLVSPCGDCSAHRLGSFQKFHLRSPAYRPNTIWLATHSEGSLSLALFPPLFLFSSFHLLWYMCVKRVAVFFPFFFFLLPKPDIPLLSARACHSLRDGNESKTEQKGQQVAKHPLQAKLKPPGRFAGVAAIW